MIVRELIEILKKYPQNKEIVKFRQEEPQGKSKISANVATNIVTVLHDIEHDKVLLF